MKRREFLKKLIGLGIGAAFTFDALPFPRPAEAEGPALRLALLADAHLKDGNLARPEARALARAVAEIRTLRPAPDLILFAGDLAHDGDPRALALGKEILSDLPAPLLLVQGEGDGRAGSGTTWSRLFGEPRFADAFQRVNVLGLPLALRPSAYGPVFVLEKAEGRWLAGALARLDPARPLIILSHAPLAPLFRPWQQWTAAAHRLAPLLAPFRQVLVVHGHVHQAGFRGQGSGDLRELSVVSTHWPENHFISFLTENRKPKTENVPLPATAWPLPSPLQGTPRRLQPGLPPHGCGWSLLTLQGRSWAYTPHLWETA